MSDRFNHVVPHVGAFSLWVWLFCAPGSNTVAQADWINLTGAETAPNIAEIYVLDDHVKLALEVYIGNLKQFEELVPNDWFKDPDAARPTVAERMLGFAQERFQFVTETGTNLSARLALAEPRMRVDRKSPFAGMVNPLPARARCTSRQTGAVCRDYLSVRYTAPAAHHHPTDGRGRPCAGQHRLHCLSQVRADN